VKEAKTEGSRLGITAFSLYVLMPMMVVLVFIGAMLTMGSSAANGKHHLIFLALSLMAFVLIVIGSVHVMVRGLLRRERDNSMNYVTFSLEPTLISLLGLQLFFACVAILIGHEGEISKVAFNPQGTKIITASSDRTCRMWDAETGDCLQARRSARSC